MVLMTARILILLQFSHGTASTIREVSRRRAGLFPFDLRQSNLLSRRQFRNTSQEADHGGHETSDGFQEVHVDM
jgi:hypothetical protein